MKTSFSAASFRCAVRSLRARAVLLTGFAMCALVTARADTTTHAWFSPYSITVVDAGTTWVSPVVNGFNGGQASLGTFGMTPVDKTTSTHYPTQTMSLVFKADAGYAFGSFFLGFGGYYWQNAPFFGGYTGAGSWSISAGNYHGATSFFESTWRGDNGWNVHGQSGDFFFQDFAWWSGGAGTFRNIMDRDGGGFDLPYVTSFTLTFAMEGRVYNDSNFGIGLESFVTLVEAPDPGPGNSVPDTGSTLVFAAAGCAALAAFRKHIGRGYAPVMLTRTAGILTEGNEGNKGVVGRKTSFPSRPSVKPSLTDGSL